MPLLCEQSRALMDSLHENMFTIIYGPHRRGDLSSDINFVWSPISENFTVYYHNNDIIEQVVKMYVLKHGPWCISSN